MCSFPIQFSSYKVLVDFSFFGSFAPSFQCRVGDSRLALWEQQVLCLRTHTYADQKHPQVQESLGQRLFPCLSVFPKHISTLYWSVTLLNAITLSSSSLVGKLSNKYLLLFSFLFLPHIHKVRKKSQCLSALCWNPAASDVQLSSGSESPSWLSNLTQQPGICVVNILAVVLSFEGIMLGFITPFSHYHLLPGFFHTASGEISSAAFGCPTDRAVPAHSVLWVGRAEGRGFEQSSTENTASISQASVKGLIGWWGRKKQEM